MQFDKLFCEHCKTNRRYNAIGELMLNKNIAKNLAFVTVICGFCLILTNCGFFFSNASNSSHKTEYDFSANYEKPKVIGTIKSGEKIGRAHV